MQEAVDLTTLAFDLAEKYRNIVMILMDGSLGQMMEPAELPPFQPIKTEVPDWAVNGESGRAKRVLTSINIDPPAQERTNIRLMSRWQEIEANEVRFKGYYLEDAEYVVIGYGTAGGSRSPRCGQRAKMALRSGCCAQSPWRPSRSMQLKR